MNYFNQSIGFIGGGRVTKIFLEAFHKKGIKFPEISVSDNDPEVLKKIKDKYPEAETYPGNNKIPASKDIVFIALHPPVIGQALSEIGNALKRDSIVVSLSPKHTIKDLSGFLGSFSRIMRIIPNGPSYINAGFNPVAFSTDLNDKDRNLITEIVTVLGDCPEVPEEKLEAYAVLTAMGPTYFWFQWEEIRRITKEFGLTHEDFNSAFKKMICGALKTYLESGLSFEEVVDLIPGKPIKEDEETIKNIYQTRLNGIYQKIKP